VDKLKTDNQELSEEIRKIKSSPAYARKVLRDKYHVTDANEKIIFFAD
jgi:cell division protein FtsB